MSDAARPCLGVLRPFAACALLAGLGWPGPSPAAAQANTRPMIDESVSGTLEAVEKGLSGIIIRSESGDRLAWRLARAAVEEAGRYKPGAPVRVHYREHSPGNRAVTAVSFLGEGAEAVYVNATGDRIVLRTGDATADGRCASDPATDQAKVATLVRGAEAAATTACFCCASADQTCGLTNRVAPGSRIVLSACFP